MHESCASFASSTFEKKKINTYNFLGHTNLLISHFLHRSENRGGISVYCFNWLIFCVQSEQKILRGQKKDLRAFKICWKRSFSKQHLNKQHYFFFFLTVFQFWSYWVDRCWFYFYFVIICLLKRTCILKIIDIFYGLVLVSLFLFYEIFAPPSI